MSFRVQTLLGRVEDRLRDEQGQGLVEYALILVLIAVVAIIALQLVGGDVTTQLSSVASSVPT